MADSVHLPVYIKFLFASISGVGSTMVCFPLDLLKTRMQVMGAGGRGGGINTLDLIKLVNKNEGILGFYSGLSASVVRQAVYTGVRLGTFQTLIDNNTHDGKSPSLFLKFIFGIFAGALGGVSGLPPDVALTRMAADATLPPEKRRNYKHVFNAISRIYKEEGFFTLYRGLLPVVVRAALMNTGQFVGYIQSKEFLLRNNILEDNTVCHVVCSVISALVATVCVLPPDMAKTRIQNMNIVDGKREYTGMIDVWIKVVKKEGPLSLWKGFTPLFLRNGPQFTVLFLIYENLVSFYNKRYIK